ncbi:MAG: hypothetical protein DRH23_12875 [Deltaproteobacteria bacterium]|nr:2Fe-2S iron-sulfur cluster binding domain-containing protein [Deltaproteobacteria bacterium]MBW2404277.1 2Fe-2S iron-sulfur cluster binding domain-containing protein [Deltaproteobacteria bacterium]MBW2546899.1 2Fe-2S iron-sulfur cluster binding domain-containing protein [Deltaproteobacteria bacterium]RLB46285.1 MAG: hypothetical protein DRH23_12875 [Deltaproteobacteria bacterium]
MAELEFLGHTYTVEDYDTVLGTLLKNGHAVPNACRGGHCHSCLMKAEEGVPMPFSQMGLAPELVNEGYFLACQCMIYADIKVTTPEREKRTRFTAMVDDKTALSDQLIRLRLRPARDYDLAGALGLLREALHHEHKGEIHLIHLCDLMAAPHLERTLSELCLDSPTISGESLSGENTKALSARL